MICQSWLKGLRRGVFPAPVAVVPFPLRAEAFFVYAVKSVGSAGVGERGERTRYCVHTRET